MQAQCCFGERSVRLVDDKQHNVPTPIPALAQFVGLASFIQGEGLSDNRSSVALGNELSNDPQEAAGGSGAAISRTPARIAQARQPVKGSESVDVRAIIPARITRGPRHASALCKEASAGS